MSVSGTGQTLMLSRTFGGRRICVLMVDDQEVFGEAVKQMIGDADDIDFHFCSDPGEAIRLANRVKPTVILQDLVMDKIDGLTVVRFFQANPATRNVPMVVLSSVEDAETKAKAFAHGANDYMVKLPDRLEVLARIRYHSRAYINLIERDEAYEAVVTTQKALESELNEAESYVTSLLPEPIDDGPVTTDWLFQSSTQLGGDAFGYHWLDDSRFAIYLLDVCGHGVGSALLSVSAINVIRNQTLPAVDFANPGDVLAAMNNTFEMEKNNNRFFTMWYGVYDREKNSLLYSSGGHPPAILVSGDGDGENFEKLSTKGLMIGGMPDVPYQTETAQIETDSRLYVFSDGVYEVEYSNGRGVMSVDDFAAELARPAENGARKVKAMRGFSQRAQGGLDFEDDFSLVEICFRDSSP